MKIFRKRETVTTTNDYADIAQTAREISRTKHREDVIKAINLFRKEIMHSAEKQLEEYSYNLMSGSMVFDVKNSWHELVAARAMQLSTDLQISYKIKRVTDKYCELDEYLQKHLRKVGLYIESYFKAETHNTFPFQYDDIVQAEIIFRW